MEVDESIDFNDFLCALDDQHNHYVDIPMSLTCGHFACKQCLMDYKAVYLGEMIKCENCNKEYRIDFDAIRESSFVRKIISSNYPALIKKLEKNFGNQLNGLRKKMDDNNKNFLLHVEFIKKEIELRYTYLKTQLDNMRDNMNKKLDFIQKEFIKKQQEIKYDDFNRKLEFLRRSIENTALDKGTLINTQTMLKKLQQTIKSIDDIPLKINLTLREEALDDSIIGNVDYNFKNALKELDNKEFKKIDLDYTPKGLCCITDNRLLVSDDTNKCLKLYDENFKLIKTIDKIKRANISPYDIIFDGSNRIYFSDLEANSITMLNSKLNFNKKIGDSKGNQNDQFDNPLGLDLSGDSVYVCDCDNKRIQKFSKDLEFEKSYPIQFKPWMIKVINNYALIRSNGEPNILLFCNLEPKMKIINKISQNPSIQKYYSGFYTFDRLNKQLKFYDVKGDLVNEIKVVFSGEVDISNCNSWFSFFNKALVMTCDIARTLVVIK